MNLKKFLAEPGQKIKLSDYPTDETGGLSGKEEAEELLLANISKMIKLQEKLYASDKYSLLLIFQGMDASGKDGAIKSVMSGLNPQGCQVTSFKQPSQEDLDHDYLWRIHKQAPERGRIGIFNRSHYEDVLIVRVRELLAAQKIPKEFIDNDIWGKRYRQISDFEKHLYENGTKIIKFFLHISKDEQKKRFLKRIDDPAKNWKFAEGDIKERAFWDEYQKCYGEAISGTSKDRAPWYIIPADRKWFARYIISEIIVNTMEKMDIDYPRLSAEQLKMLDVYKQKLLDEN
ncbi:MAG TPA: polyphosphate kinase 2 family protein [Ignavibacteriales bacterium]|nr:polyphosphate kinase 2 family protein [Ignavibacteriales bacterium]